MEGGEIIRLVPDPRVCTRVYISRAKSQTTRSLRHIPKDSDKDTLTSPYSKGLWQGHAHFAVSKRTVTRTHSLRLIQKDCYKDTPTSPYPKGLLQGHVHFALSKKDCYKDTLTSPCPKGLWLGHTHFFLSKRTFTRTCSLRHVPKGLLQGHAHFAISQKDCYKDTLTSPCPKELLQGHTQFPYWHRHLKYYRAPNIKYVLSQNLINNNNETWVRGNISRREGGAGMEVGETLNNSRLVYVHYIHRLP